MISNPQLPCPSPHPVNMATPEPAHTTRTIDENTDLSTLTDQEIMRLMEGMDHTEQVMTRVSIHT